MMESSASELQHGEESTSDASDQPQVILCNVQVPEFSNLTSKDLIFLFISYIFWVANNL